MQNKTERLQTKISNEVHQFRQKQRTLQLATLDSEQFPHASYAPFVYHELCYFILISDLAIHGQNLKHNNKVGIAIMEDEANTANIFARRRLTYTAIAEHIERDSQTWQFIIEQLVKNAGETTTILSQLGDFNLYRLVPLAGRYVKGFAQAYSIDAAELPGVSALNAKGHVSLN